MPAGLMGQQPQHISAAAIGAGDITLVLVDMQEYARMTQRPAATVTGDFERIDFDDFK